MYNRTRMAAAACIIGLGALASAPAFAQHWHGGARVGVYAGVPLYAPYYYPPVYYGYAYPPIIYAPPAAPPVYVERGEAQPAPQAAPPAQPQSDWYFCPDSNGYYPYVKSCASGWQRVPPQPPAPTRQGLPP
jgi:hypothetical protein